MTFLLLLLGSLARNAVISWHVCCSSLPIFILCRPFFQLLLRSSPSDDGWYVYICCEGIRILAIMDTKILKIIELKLTIKPSLFYFEEWTRFWYLVMHLLPPPPPKKKKNEWLPSAPPRRTFTAFLPPRILMTTPPRHDCYSCEMKIAAGKVVCKSSLLLLYLYIISFLVLWVNYIFW